MEYPMENRDRRRLSVGVGLFLTCLVLTAVVGLFAGLMISNYTHNNYVMYAEKAEAAAPAPQKELQRESNVIASTAVPTQTNSDTEAKVETVGAFSESGQFTKAQIVEMSAPSVVGIDTISTATTNSYWYGYGQSYDVPGSGSGVILTEDGYIATCAHVVEGAKSVKVTLNDDTAYDATIVGTDKRNDIAIIKIDATGLTPAVVGDSETLTVGSEVIAIGNPLGELRGTATAGIISATNRTIEVESQTMTLIQTDAAISPGNSGGGLFDATGKLIGIVNAKVSDSRAEGLGFAIPVNSVLDEISDLLNYGYVTGRPYLGVSTQDVTLRSRSGGWYYSSGTRCVMVEKVVPGSAAEQAGIQSGDLILKLGDKQVTSGDELSSAIGAYKPGDTAIITLQRNNQEMTVEVTFGEYAPQR
ncbi:MAG: trypsin-like peptidase domain-containing protein [Clostridia bacterium]|nr:trypsin-like peptidase domain-containing protein [Clostridia bacterium]